MDLPSLYHVTLTLLALKAVFFAGLTTVVWAISGVRSRSERRRRAEDEYASIFMMLALMLVSIADFDLIRDTHNIQVWRTLVRGFAFLVELWVLSTIYRDWRDWIARDPPSPPIPNTATPKISPPATPREHEEGR